MQENGKDQDNQSSEEEDYGSPLENEGDVWVCKEYRDLLSSLKPDNYSQNEQSKSLIEVSKKEDTSNKPNHNK